MNLRTFPPHPLRFCFALGAAASFFTGSLPAATVNIIPTADTSLYEAYPTYNFGDGTTFTSGGRRKGGRTRALMLFDIAGHVPVGATISSVTLTLTVEGTPSGGVNSTFDLNRLNASWGEGNGADFHGSPATTGQSTWNSRFSGSSTWSSPGGDFSSTVSGALSVTVNAAYTFSSTANLVADVQGWLNNPTSDFGWLLRSESESSPTSIRRFDSRNSAAPPTLSITYTVVPEPSTISLLGIGFGAAAFFRRRRST